jgi:murein DD-endopeptidase MepM/ murein hydrolase activator NlpD
MPMKKYTVMIMSDPTAKVRKIKVPAPAPFQMITSAIVIVLLTLSFSIYFISDYVRMKSQLKELNSLRKENTVQRFQLQAFNKDLGLIKTGLNSLKNFDHKLRVMADLDKIPDSDFMLGIGGPGEISLPPEYQTDLSAQISEDLNDLRLNSARQEISFQELTDFFSDQKSILACTPSIWPVRGWITSSFGRRIDPFTGYRKMHEGLDVATRTGTPVIAPCNGIVTKIKRDYGYGKMLEVNSGNGIVTRYGHNSKIVVRVGTRVKRGDLIAYVGNTGRSTGPHLHYEVIVNGVHVNPMKYILN